jgi:uncharacterized protein (TIGR03067 family)
MTTSPDCPDSGVLRKLLDGNDVLEEGTHWTHARVEQHVNHCEICQRSIERLVAGQESWEGTAKQLAELEARRADSSTETPALRDLIDHEKDRLPDTIVSATNPLIEENLAEIPLDFLLPSDQADSRGRLGAYEILEVVGRGGMGLVLKAYDPSLRRIVAIKVMAGHLASSPLARKRFVREARAAAAISHDHVVAIHAVEDKQEPPFLVMQFVSGKTLQERLMASGPLAVTEILRIGMQTASGLAAAHAQGLVHRDIKPANILLENGVERVKITDFGLARAVDDVGMTRTGTVAGTPQFMAPEQANGESIDVRSDLFSLGSVLYLMCTGRPPFRATTTMGLLKRICEETPRPIRELNPDIPEWLAAIIDKLLQKKLSNRFQTAKEVEELLGQWLAHVQRPTTVPAPQTTAPVASLPIESPTVSVSADKNVIAEPASPQPLLRTFSLSGEYSRRGRCPGNAERAFDLAMSSLTTAGFALQSRTKSRLSMSGPGLNRLRGNTLAAASSIEIQQESGTLQLDASMGTIRNLYGILIGIYLLSSLIIGGVMIGAGHPERFILFLVIGAFLGLSFLATRREIRKTFDRFFCNLAGTTAEDGRSSAFVQEMVAPPAGNTSFRQRLREAYPSRIHVILAVIWGAFSVPLTDTLDTFPFPGIHQLAIVYFTFAFGFPTIVLLYAWYQRLQTGDWKTTVLRGSPGRLLAIPTLYLLVGATLFWTWRQATCGIVTFNIDDPNLTVSLTWPDSHTTYSYSADFYALRLKAGKYHWGVKHGSTVIAGGEFQLTPRGNQVISVSSPYRRGEADLAFLPGRWKLSTQLTDGSRWTLARESKDSAYIDLTETELRTRSRDLIEALYSISRLPNFTSVEGPENEKPPQEKEMVYSVQFSSPPAGERGPKRIDLSLVDPVTKVKRLTAYGIIFADAKTLMLRLTSINSRPTSWDFVHGDKSIMFQFLRADDFTMLQGDWHFDKNNHVAFGPNSDPPYRLVINGEQVTVLTKEMVERQSPSSLVQETNEGALFHLKIDPTQDPKRITLTSVQSESEILVKEGIYRLDGDQLEIAFGGDGRIPREFDVASKSSQAHLNLRRVKP